MRYAVITLGSVRSTVEVTLGSVTYYDAAKLRNYFHTDKESESFLSSL